MNLRKMRKHALLCRSTRVMIRVTQKQIDEMSRSGTTEEQVQAWVHSLIPPLRPGSRTMFTRDDHMTGDKVVIIESR